MVNACFVSLLSHGVNFKVFLSEYRIMFALISFVCAFYMHCQLREKVEAMCSTRSTSFWPMMCKPLMGPLRFSIQIKRAARVRIPVLNLSLAVYLYSLTCFSPLISEISEIQRFSRFC